MCLQRVVLQNFRSYSKAEFDFSSVTVVVGENGSGKSNLMEAIYLLATGKSFRADRDSEMVLYNAQYSMLNAQIDDISLQVTITDRKKFEVNGVARRQIDFVGKLRAVLFSPQDLELVTGSPSGRRRYLDFVISQMDREYRRCLISYEKGLRQRNKLLDLLHEGLADKNQLFFWDRLLIKNGEYITKLREAYLADLAESANLAYRAEYDRSVISEARLKQYELEEVAAAATLVGPHRDDFVIQILNSKFENPNKSEIQNHKYLDVSRYGSRGEQRMAVLWLKRGEIRYLGENPLLLLDDIFSELDHKHREEVSRLVDQHRQAGGQVVLTAAETNLLPSFGEVETITL